MYKIGIVGENCLDTFVYCESERLAPDLPVPILKEISRKSNRGMAGNVVDNIAALNGGFDFPCYFNEVLPEKVRFVHERTNHTFFRVDYNDRVDPFVFNFDAAGKFLECEYLIISDYNKGFLNESALKFIIDSHPKVIIDSKKKIGKWCENAYLIKINEYEFNRSTEITEKAKVNCIVTLGQNGARYRDSIYPVEPCEVKDSSGAGDTFFAGLIYSHCIVDRSISESIRFANKCASEIVKHRGVTVINKESIS